MTPDQELKSALLGDASTSRDKSRKRARREAGKPRRKSRLFRWSVKILTVVLMLSLTRGLMRTPEVQAMVAEAQEKLVAFMAEERNARRLAAAKDLLAGHSASAQTAEPSAESRAPMPGNAVPTAHMPGNRINVRQMSNGLAQPNVSGPVEAVYAGNVLRVAGVTLLIENLHCQSPDTERGQRALRGLNALTQAQSLTCAVTGVASQDVLTASCQLKGGRDLYTEMMADRLCDEL